MQGDRLQGESGYRPIVGIVQARMGSTRLPGKVLKEICGRPILWHVTNRLSHSERIDTVVVATTTEGEDDRIAEWCKEQRIPFYRGSSQDVLDRYFMAAREFGARTIVRITADCPLIDPVLVDMAVDKLIWGGYDYVGLGSPFPDGLDTEVFTLNALKTAWREAVLASEREHVTPYIWKNPDRFMLSSVRCEGDYSAMRWTVDEESDLQFVTAVYEGFDCTERPFGMKEILDFLDKNPGLLEINAGIRRNEGYEKSLKEDRIVDTPVHDDME